MKLSPALPLLTTERLIITAGDPEMAAELADYQRRNLAHFCRWDPFVPPGFFEVATQRERIVQGLKAFAEGSAYRYWLQPRTLPARIIGSVNLSQVSRGVFHSAVLGYGLDEQHLGQGLMHEALQAVVAEAFSPRINLHRLQAAAQPANGPSLATLTRLGFEPEGLARDYLFINGTWRDHRLFALRNPDFRPPSGWADTEQVA